MKKLTALLTAFLIMVAIFVPTAVHAETDPELGFEISSEAVYMVNNESGIVIYQKNADTKLDPASLATIMTAIVAIENCPDLENTIVTAQPYIFDEIFTLGAMNVDMKHREEARMIDLLYAMILRSACECANIIADYIGNGDISAFVQMMNDKAAEIGAVNTHFANPHGLPNDDSYSTAKDMYLIFDYAMDNFPIFAEIASTPSYVMPATNKHSSERSISHTNTMLVESSDTYYPYMTAGKTGATNTGRNLASAATKDAYSYTLVTMNAQRYYDNGDEITDNMSFVDTKQLYDWAFNNWSVRSVVKTSTNIDEVKVELASDVDAITVFPDQDVDYLMRNDIDMSSLQKVIHLEDSYDAPIQSGQVLGTMELKLADTTIATVNLVSGQDVERSTWLYILRGIQNFFGSIWFKLIIAVLLLLIAGYIAFAILYNNRKTKRRRRKTKRRF